MRAFLALAALLLIAGCGGGSDERASVKPAPAGEEPARRAPAVEGVTLDGEQLSLADFRGRPVFVNVWSSW